MSENQLALDDNKNSFAKLLRCAKATALFELARSLTGGRLAAATILALFPPSMTMLTLLATNYAMPHLVIIGVTVFMVILLAQLLWAAPVVHTELEGKTWIYLASRPQGRVSTVLGKYAIAVFWGFNVAWTAMTLCMLGVLDLFTPHDLFYHWLIFTLMIALACIAYGSVFTLIGALFHRRAMVFCAGYALLSEVVLANIPAVISRFTVQFHLASLAVDLLGIDNPAAPMQHLYREQGPWTDLFLIFLITISCLAATIYTLRSREYITADEA